MASEFRPHISLLELRVQEGSRDIFVRVQCRPLSVTAVGHSSLKESREIQKKFRKNSVLTVRANAEMLR